MPVLYCQPAQLPVSNGLAGLLGCKPAAALCQEYRIILADPWVMMRAASRIIFALRCWHGHRERPRSKPMLRQSPLLEKPGDSHLTGGSTQCFSRHYNISIVAVGVGCP